MTTYTCSACPCWQQTKRGPCCVGGPARYGESCSASEGAERSALHTCCWGRFTEIAGKKKNAPEVAQGRLL